MRTLLSILLAFKEYFLLLLCVVISVILLASNDNRQLHALRAYAIGFLGATSNAVSVIPNIFTLQHENVILRQLNVNLSDEVSRLREARIENTRLRVLLGLREEAPFNLIAADVVGKSLLLMRNTLTLNVGEREGIRPDMPIIAEQGLVGKIIAVGDGYSLAQVLFNKEFRAAAKLQRSRVDGIISWDGGAALQLINVPKTQDVRTSDIVITSEYSNVFPSDITIGIVSRVTQKSGSLFRGITVMPAVDFTTLEQVFIIAQTPDSSRTVLEQRALLK